MVFMDTIGILCNYKYVIVLNSQQIVKASNNYLSRKIVPAYIRGMTMITLGIYLSFSSSPYRLGFVATQRKISGMFQYAKRMWLATSSILLSASNTQRVYYLSHHSKVTVKASIKVSRIITPTFNDLVTLGACLFALSNQDSLNFLALWRIYYVPTNSAPCWSKRTRLATGYVCIGN